MTWTDKPPTRAGAYWWKDNQYALEHLALVVDTGNGRLAKYGCPLSGFDLSGLWCGPLVPAEEVEKAYKEGVKTALNSPPYNGADWWTNSRAKRVMEGEV